MFLAQYLYKQCRDNGIRFTMANKVFITGASGFLGRNLLEELAKKYTDDVFYVLARSDSTARSLSEKFSWMGKERLNLVRGDVGQDNLGMTEKIKKIDIFWHLAASTSFDDSKRAEIQKVNKGGTENVIRFLQGCDIKRFYHFSTAYACGIGPGPVPEGQIESSNSFRNPYEESKFEAENIVRKSGIPYIIFRPSILIGNSKSGLAEGEIRMAYGYLLGMYQSVLHSEKFRSESKFWDAWHKAKSKDDYTKVDCRLRGYPETTKNMLAIDNCVEMVLSAIRKDCVGATYNLVNPQAIMFKETIEAMEEALHVQGFRPGGDLQRTELDKKNRVELTAYKLTKPYWPYVMNSDPVWHTGNTEGLENKTAPMTKDLFHMLMLKFVEDKLIKNGDQDN
jgi:nucleoside-diphosphate-sugar epimerase